MTAIFPGATGLDVWIVGTAEGSRPRPIVATPASETAGAFSPDGRWLSYSSDDSGRSEIYVQPYPDGGRRWLVSRGGGSGARWLRSGREIVYRNANQMMSVAVKTANGFETAAPRVLFEVPSAIVGAAGWGDVTADGERFLMVKGPEGPGPQIVVAPGFLDEVRARLRAAGSGSRSEGRRMTLSAGTPLGPYEILSPSARAGWVRFTSPATPRLDRTVAVKVLPARLAQDSDRRARFEREARAVSALNHPHICTIHDVGQQDGIDYLVMEHLEGETLADRLEKGALPQEQALWIGAQVADALDKAHRAGIVHRDLKPGNVMLTKTGAKLLDFGLARVAEPAGIGAGEASPRSRRRPSR